MIGPIHPKLVHFPIALFITALVLDILGRALRRENLHDAAVVIYITATLFTPIVVCSGLWEQQRLHLYHPVLTQHKLFAFMTLGVSWVSLPMLWFMKKKSVKVFRTGFTFFLLCMALLVTATGYWGGKMVFEYGAGVNQ